MTALTDLLQWLTTRNIVLVIGILFALYLFSIEAGYYLGHWKAKRKTPDERQLAGISTITAGMLGAAAFVMGLTISFAQNRFEERRQVVVLEANAIGTAWLRAQLIPGLPGAMLETEISDYAKVRLDYVSAAANGSEASLLVQTSSMQNQMWRLVKPLAQQTPTPIVASLIASLNDMFDASLTQRVAFESRVPQALTLMLLAGSMMSLGAIGFQFGHAGTRQSALSLLLLVMWVGSFYLVIDFNRPRLGAIRADPAPLAWTLDGFSQGTEPP